MKGGGAGASRVFCKKIQKKICFFFVKHIIFITMRTRTPSDTNTYIYSARKRLGMRQSDFAEAAGISIPTLKAMERGTRPITAAVLGRAEKLLRDHGISDPPPTPEQARLLAAFGKLTDGKKEIALITIEALAATPQ